jgi:hypothetical protein
MNSNKCSPVKFKILVPVSVLATVILISCNEKGGKNIDEGEIHYGIDYIKSTGTLSEDFKPQTLVVSFKKDKILFEILSPIGGQGIVNIVNPDENIYDTYISIVPVRYYYEGAKGETHPGFESMAGLKLRKTDQEKVISGYDCHNAKVVFPGDSIEYDIWYTNQINVKNTNESTPYEEIDGVLMSFYFLFGSSLMHFEAESVYTKTVPDDSFERKPKYKLVSREYMGEIISRMVNL